MNIFKHLCIVILSVTTLSNFASQDWQDSSYKRSSSSSSSSSSLPSRSMQSSTPDYHSRSSSTSHASQLNSTQYNNSNNANQSQHIYMPSMPSDYFSNQSQNHSDENDKNDIKLIKGWLNAIAHSNPNRPYSCPVRLTDMDSNRFKALAQAAAQEIAQEALQGFHNEIKNMDNTRSNHALTRWGITALEDNHTYAPQPQNDDSDDEDEDEVTTRTNSDIVHKVYAQMQLHIAQQLLPLSFHWNILPISHKAGFAAITALAVVGVYKLGSMLFGPSKQLAYDPSLVAAANNQSDQ